MKCLRLILLLFSVSCLLLLPVPQMAFASGAYIGTQLGWGNVHQGDYLSKRFRELVYDIFTANELRDYTVLFNNTGLAGRIFAGYQFNDIFGLELGYARFSNLHIETAFNANVTIQQRETPFWVKISLDARAQTYVIDLMAKLVWPMTEHVDIYTKMGLAYLQTTSHVCLQVQTEILQFALRNNPSLNLIYPVLGLGASYHFTPHIAADFSWEHIQRYNAKSFPNLDFVSLGLLYHFV